MKERINISIQSISIIAVTAGIAWVVWSGDTTMREMLTYLIVLVALIEMVGLYLVGKIYPENHTSFKLGIIAFLLILLGVKSILPEMFVSLTITAFAINFLYNFYANMKRRKGGFKKREGKKFNLK
jgi:hypothetical protein